MGVAESDGNDAERNKDADSGGSLRYCGTKMTDMDEEPNVDAGEFGNDYGGREREAERMRKRR